MADKNNDRKSYKTPDSALPKPHIEIIVDGTSVFKPGMKTYFSESEGRGAITSAPSDEATSAGGYSSSSKSVVGGTYCTCDTVYVTRPSYSKIEGTKKETCSCNSHCTCQSVSSCPAYKSSPYTTPCSANYGGNSRTTPCSSNYSGGGSVSCNGPCACVPVH